MTWVLRPQNFYKFKYLFSLVTGSTKNKFFMSSKCLGYFYGVGWVGGWVDGWMGWSYNDIKTNLSQVGLNLDCPTGINLANF